MGYAGNFVDTFTRPQTAPLVGSFRMPIGDAFYVKSIDRVVAVGKIAEGSVKPGNRLFVRSCLASFPVVVEQVETIQEARLQGMARAAAHQTVGLILKGIGKDQALAGGVVLAESMMDPAKVKQDSERIILERGGEVCHWLPPLEHSVPRGSDEIIGRALAMNALVSVYFGAPIPIIRRWVVENGVESHLSDWERGILAKGNGQLSKLELANLGWDVEGLWALMWVGSLVEALPFDRPVEGYMANLAMDLQNDMSRFPEKMRIRPYGELFWMRDLYYRVQGGVGAGQIGGCSTGNVSLEIVLARRRALEWAVDCTADWDSIGLGT